MYSTKKELEKLLRAYGWPRRNPYTFSEMEKKFAEHNISYFQSAFDIAVDFDGIIGSFGQFHNNVYFETQYFLGAYDAFAVGKTSNAVGKKLIPFAKDDDMYIWLVSEDGNIYTDWSDIICFQGDNIFSALVGALDDYEGISLISKEI